MLTHYPVPHEFFWKGTFFTGPWVQGTRIRSAILSPLVCDLLHLLIFPFPVAHRFLCHGLRTYICLFFPFQTLIAFYVTVWEWIHTWKQQWVLPFSWCLNYSLLYIDFFWVRHRWQIWELLLLSIFLTLLISVCRYQPSYSVAASSCPLS